MRVTVRLYGALRRYRSAEAEGAAHQPFNITVPAGETVADLGRRLGIPAGSLTTAAVNGEHAEGRTALADGDTVHFFPPAAGG
ncbi:MAG TPA: MoaD/ThiS family protein [Candidatus Sulfomarinibacteraceae bacterium]|nr:MoaD/ThiS family protein [Candidatus Sulfomarinibacteraceae bacterium]